MTVWIDRIRTLILRAVAHKHFVVLLSVAAIASGIALEFASLVPDIEFAGSTTVSGTLMAFSTRNDSFEVDAGLSEMRLENTACSVFVTVLSPAELAEYLATGRRPAPHLDCDHRAATFMYPLRGIVIENRGGSEEAYEISGRFFAVRATRGFLALAAFPLLLGGSVLLLVRGFRRGIDRIQEERRNMYKEK